MFTRPRLLIRMKFGIRVIPAGTMSVARTSAMTTRLPCQRSLARA